MHVNTSHVSFLTIRGKKKRKAQVRIESNKICLG